MTDIRSESDAEIVHTDGTVTDKRDGVRRSYAAHVAQAGIPHPPAAMRSSSSSSSHPAISRRAQYLLAGAAGAVGAGLAVVVERLAG